MRRMSLGAKLAALNIAVLAACSIAIAGILNISALAMADAIEAQVALPARSIDEDLQEAGEIEPQDGIQAPTAAVGEGEPAALVASQAQSDYLAASAATLAVFVCAGAAATYLLVKRETRGIADLARHLRACSPDELARPFRAPAANRETAALIEAFNGLGGRTSEAIAAQRRFALAAAHELKTPLAAMRARLDVFAKRADPSPADIDRLTSTLSAQTDRLSALVSQLLELARSSTADRGEAVDPSAIVLDAVREVSTRTGARIDTSRVEAGQTVMADRELLSSAVRNALENAVAYGRAPYRISCSPGRIVVSNAGEPIPEDDREALFEPFRRGDGSRSRASGGCGLGLATTRGIMRAHGGDARFLTVESGVSLELTYSPRTDGDAHGA